jgi:GNAT superfamily N-acetyltransferase
MMDAIYPVTEERWPDLERFFRAHGNPNYCWCMTWRAASSEFRAMDSGQRREALHAILAAGQPVGLLAYKEGQPVGWCSVAPRPTYPRLERSPTRPRLDDLDTWSVVCFFLAPEARGLGLSVKLLRAAIEYAAASGAEVVEGYPVEPVRDENGKLSIPASYRFMGYRGSFEKAGFVDTTPPGAKRTVMRFDLRGWKPAGTQGRERESSRQPDAAEQR